MPTTIIQTDQVLGIDAVVQQCGISKASVYRLMRTGNFPRAMPLTPRGRRVGWRLADVQEWCREPMAWGAEPEF